MKLILGIKIKEDTDTCLQTEAVQTERNLTTRQEAH